MQALVGALRAGDTKALLGVLGSEGRTLISSGDPSPLGDLVVRARAEGYRRAEGGGPTPFHGYLYRMLTAQGPDAPDGKYDYSRVAT